MKQPHVHKRIKNKLPPILEVDEDGVPTFELDTFEQRWSVDGDAKGVQLGDWPIELDD